MYPALLFVFFFFFNDTATTEIYTLSLHDALPICDPLFANNAEFAYYKLGRNQDSLYWFNKAIEIDPNRAVADRKSTRLNSSHQIISYAVFCLKKKNQAQTLIFRDL